MSNQNLINRISLLQKQRNVIAFTMVSLLVIALLLAFEIVTKDQTEIVLPSQITGEYKFQGNKISGSYLVDKGVEALTYILSVTPSNADYKLQKITKIIHPNIYQPVKEEFMEMIDDIKSRNITTYFYPMNAIADEEKKGVKITGELHTSVGKNVEIEKQTYWLGFHSTGTEVFLTEFKQIVNEAKNEI